MKFKELTNVVTADELVDLEILGESYPEEFSFGDIIKKYPRISEYKVVSIGSAYRSTDSNAKLYIEVTE